MSQQPDYDAIIVGGGPAGSTAGALLCESGYRVALFEKARFPRRKVCGGCLSQKTIRFLDRVYHASIPDMRREGVPCFEGKQYAIYLGDSRIRAGDLEEPFYFTRRDRYDAWLARMAADAGVEIREGEGVAAVDHGACSVTTVTGDRYTARALIGADGIHSMVRRSLPAAVCDPDRWERNLGWALELFIPREEVMALADRTGSISLDANLTTPHLVFAACRWGYGWIFPNDDCIIVGIGGLLRKNKKEFPGRFKQFLAAAGLAAFADRKPQGYPFPFGNFMAHPAFAKTLLIGDAGGFADPLIGEGIFYAHRTAELAAHAVQRHVRSGEPLERIYTALIREHVIPELGAATRLRDILYGGIDAGMSRPVGTFISLTCPSVIEVFQGLRSFRWFSRDDDLHAAVG
jgi:geranylgeranyl reductase family protein